MASLLYLDDYTYLTKHFSPPAQLTNPFAMPPRLMASWHSLLGLKDYTIIDHVMGCEGDLLCFSRVVHSYKNQRHANNIDVSKLYEVK